MKTSAMPGAQAATSSHTNSLWEHQSFGDKRVSGWDGVAIAQAAGVLLRCGARFGPGEDTSIQMANAFEA
jgi:hypothetical protein